MTISSFIPNLQPLVEHISVELRFVCYFILTASIIARVARSQHYGGASSLAKPIITAAIITGLIATLPFWFNLIREVFWDMAMSIREEFASSVAPTGTALMQLLQPPEDGINWLDITDSLMKAVQYALGWIIVFLGAIIQFPMMLVQYVMECLCYLFLPIALALLSLESTKGLGIRYLQQTLAILAWPVGFAVVDLVGYSLLTSVPSLIDAAASSPDKAAHFTPNNFMLGGLVALWLILGSLGTPVIMQMLFCSGSPLSSLIGHAIQMGLMAAGMLRMGTGASAIKPAVNPPTSAPPQGGGGEANPGSSPAPPSAPPPVAPASPSPHTPPPPSTSSSTPPSGFTQPEPKSPLYDPLVDPTGDRRAADLMAMSQIHKPIHY